MYKGKKNKALVAIARDEWKLTAASKKAFSKGLPRSHGASGAHRGTEPSHSASRAHDTGQRRQLTRPRAAGGARASR